MSKRAARKARLSMQGLINSTLVKYHDINRKMKYRVSGNSQGLAPPPLSDILIEISIYDDET